MNALTKLIKPHHFLKSYQDITPEFIQTNEIRLILSDLDGTLAPENEMGDETFAQWLSSIRAVGVDLIVVSNNKGPRVQSFAEEHGLMWQSNCQKPSTRRIKKLFIDKGIPNSAILFLGDQLFTDILCGKRLGVQTAVVKPIPGNETWKTTIKRGTEQHLYKMWDIPLMMKKD